MSSKGKNIKGHEANKKMTSKDAIIRKDLKCLTPPNTNLRGWDESSEVRSGEDP